MKIARPVTLVLLAAMSLSACGFATDSVTTADSVEPTTCAEIIPDVITITEDGDAAGQMLAIYKPTLVEDHIAGFNDETFKIPADKNEVEVLTCSGEASFSDGSQWDITYGLMVDTNGDIFYRFESV